MDLVVDEQSFELYFLCESINKLNKTTIQNLKKKIKPKKKRKRKRKLTLKSNSF